MTVIKDFTQHLIKKDIDILLSEDESVVRNNFPKKFIDPHFHNNVIMKLKNGKEVSCYSTTYHWSVLE